MGTLWQLTRAGLLLGTMLGLAVFDAHANQLAPRPIEQGEWYVGAFAGFERFRTPEFKALELYKDDSMVGGGGLVTIEDQQGYLLEQRIKSTEFVPGFHFGYGFGEGPEDGVYRIEFSAEVFDRKESYSNASTTPASDGFFVDDGMGGETEVGLVARYGPIDGDDNDDGTDPYYLFGGPVIDEELDIKEESRSANVSLYFDSRNGPWVFSRGVSVMYTYFYQKIDHEYQDPTLDGFPGITGQDDYTFSFRYRSKSHTIGSRLHYSAGYEFIKGWTLFTHGRFGFAAKHTNIEGKQAAPCLSSCDVINAPFEFAPGTRKIDINDWKFAYDARMGFGTSLRVGPLRLTAHGGGTRIGGWTTPREDEEGVRVAKSGGWGYYASASVDVAF